MTIPYHPLQTHLEVAVPLYIAAMQGRGGPDDAELEAARAFGRVLAERGDVLLYGGKPGEAGELADGCAKSIAVLSFSPGGVTVFGRTWAAGELNDTSEHDAEVCGMYYTPRAIIEIIEPCVGSGAFLVELAQNPPWGES